MRRSPANLVHAEALSPHARALAEGGAPVERLFESCGIPLAAVSTSDAIITMRQAHQLMEKAARYTGEENFGSQAGMDLKLYELGELGHAVRQAPTLNEAGKVVMSAIHASEPGSQCWIEKHDNVAWFCYRPIERLGPGGAQAEQFDLECLLQFIRLAGGHDWIPRKVRVSCASANVLARTRHFSEAEVEQDEYTTAIAFPSQLLAKAIPDSPEVSSEISSRKSDPTSESPPGISAAVVLSLESLLEFEALPTLEVMADRLGVNGRMLQRLLAGEGTTYRRLTERILFRRAVRRLGESRLSIKEIASELGYSSSSSFIRTFARIAGTTPMAYRKLELHS
jgi:AraC-like DNA-binding protein